MSAVSAAALVSAHKVQLREASFEDHHGIAALEHSQNLASKPFEEWRRLWTDNPCYQRLRPRWPIGWVLVAEQRVVGCLSNIPLDYVFRGRKLLAAAGRGWAVEDQFRGYSLLLMDEYFNQENVDVFLNNTVNGKATEAFSTFGSLRVPAGNWGNAAFFIVGHRAFVESALRIKQIPQARLLSYPLGSALWLKDRFAAKRIPSSTIEVGLTRDFDLRFEPFWERLRELESTLLAVRSREFLQWHFSASILRGDIWIITAEKDNNLEAYAIFQRRDEPQYGLKRMRMVDFQACERHDEYCAALTRRAYQECRTQGIYVLEKVGCELERTRVFEQLSPYRRKLSSWSFYYLTKDTEIAAKLSRPEAWAPSSYDGDASL